MIIKRLIYGGLLLLSLIINAHAQDTCDGTADVEVLRGEITMDIQDGGLYRIGVDLRNNGNCATEGINLSVFTGSLDDDGEFVQDTEVINIDLNNNVIPAETSATLGFNFPLDAFDIALGEVHEATYSPITLIDIDLTNNAGRAIALDNILVANFEDPPVFCPFAPEFCVCPLFPPGGCPDNAPNQSTVFHQILPIIR